VGALVLGTSPRLRMDEEYRVFLALAAGQVAAAVTDAQAVESERRRGEERAELDRARAQFYTEVAVTLQRAVLGPTALPDGFAVHYEPATGTLEVGGDWYDVVDLPGGRHGVMVGDVVGRGLPAAAVMGQLRSAIRALASTGLEPGALLDALDRFVARHRVGRMTTVAYAQLDVTTGELLYACAGHPPPVLLAPGAPPCLLWEGRSVPLDSVGLAGPRRQAAAQLQRGATLLLYTDGLVERRNEDLDSGMARAVTALTDGRHLAPDQLVALLTDQLLDDAPDDDVALLLYRCG
jgi:serine phosphatase RsbU (regulator of sigma subunit)